MSSKKYNKKSSSKGGFPWKTSFFLLLFLIGTLVAYDTHQHGSFEATRAGKFMRESGITAYLEKSWVSIKLYSAKSLEYLEATSPEYYKAVADFCTPYIKLVGNLSLIVKNSTIKLYDNASAYIAAKAPELRNLIEYYIPGLSDSVQKNFVRGMELTKIYSTWIVEQVIENFAKTTRWLKTNLFVGNLSPENLQNYASKAINTTQNFATKTYDWVYEKVQTLSKVE